MSGQCLADEHYFADPANTRWIYGSPSVEHETVTEFVAVIAPWKRERGSAWVNPPGLAACLPSSRSP